MTLDFDWVSKKIFWHTEIRKILGIFTFEENPYSKPMGGGRGKYHIIIKLKKIVKIEFFCLDLIIDQMLISN